MLEIFITITVYSNVHVCYHVYGRILVRTTFWTTLWTGHAASCVGAHLPVHSLVILYDLIWGCIMACKAHMLCYAGSYASISSYDYLNLQTKLQNPSWVLVWDVKQ